MKIYFSRITTDHWTLHNKAQKLARSLAYAMDRMIIPEDDVEKFKKVFKTGIEKINAENPRCKEIELIISDDYFHKRDITFEVSGNFYLSLFEARDANINMLIP